MKVGDIVARKSYNKDIVFKITDIIVDENGKKIAILKGVAFRIIADAELSDLEILKPPDIREILMDKNVESILYRSLKKAKDRPICSFFLHESPLPAMRGQKTGGVTAR